jgi:hypothetical protein
MRKVKFSSKFENPRERKKCVKEVLCCVLFVRVLKERVTRNREFEENEKGIEVLS